MPPAATHGEAGPETVVEADTAAEAGVLFPAPEEPVPAEGQLSPGGDRLQLGRFRRFEPRP